MEIDAPKKRLGVKPRINEADPDTVHRSIQTCLNQFSLAEKEPEPPFETKQAIFRKFTE